MRPFVDLELTQAFAAANALQPFQPINTESLVTDLPLAFNNS